MTIGGFIGKYAPLWRGHTPGHKGTLCARDVTEILDVFPGGLIEEAEARGAKLYGAEKLRFLTGGSSIGIKAAVLAAQPKAVLTDSYRHRAVDEAALLARARLALIKNAEGEDGLPVLTTAESVRRALSESGADCVVVQYPDYYGRAADLGGIAEEARSAGATLIVDSAHGAHFALRPDLFPQSAVAEADACNMSAHKTLGGLTQTAFLAARGELAGKVDGMLDALGTTSPNYVLLASLEACVDGADRLRARYDGLKEFSDAFRSRHKCLDNDDFTRIVADCGEGNGKRAAYAFYERGVAAEKYDGRYVVFILTPYDGEEGLGALAEAADRVLGRGTRDGIYA